MPRKSYLIVKGRYYILHVKDLLNIKCLKYFYVSRQIAKDCIKAHIPAKERKYYKVVSGIYLKKYQPNIWAGMKLKGIKYRYKKGMTFQERKNYRTIFRRRLRRMNIFVKGNTTGKIYQAAKRVKYVKNKQTVAQSPTSEARVICIDRRGINKWYLINEVLKAKRAGDLFRISSYCFDFKKQVVYHKELRVKNTDVITPYLLSELKTKLSAKNWEINEETWEQITKPILRRIG